MTMRTIHRLAAISLALLATACVAPPPSTPLTSGQVASQVPPQIEERLKAIGPVVAPPETEPLYAPLQEKEPYANVSVKRNIPYGNDPRNLLDVFTPAAPAAGPRPVLIFVHGGAFMRGDRRTGTSPFYDNIMLWAVRNGMVGVNMTYRLAPQYQWPSAVDDMASAVKWVRTNIAASGGDPQRIVLMGHSAGAAHVAQYLGHTGFQVAPGGGVAAAIMVSGLYDIPKAQVNPPLQAYFGNDPSKYAQRSALPGMQLSTVPMLFAFAQMDPEDFRKQAIDLRTTMCGPMRCSPVLELMGHSHMSEIMAINTDDHSLTDPMLTFLRSTVKLGR